MVRGVRLMIAATVALALSASASVARAGTSTQAFVAEGAVVRDDVANTLTLGDWSSNLSQAGQFIGYTTPVDFGTVVFNKSATGSGILSFSNSSFGSFTSSSYVVVTIGAEIRQFMIYGSWAPPQGKTVPASGPASLSLSVSDNGSLSASGVLSVPPVPEPSSVVLGLTSLAIGGLAHRLRRRRASS